MEVFEQNFTFLTSHYFSNSHFFREGNFKNKQETKQLFEQEYNWTFKFMGNLFKEMYTNGSFGTKHNYSPKKVTKSK